MDAKIVAKIRRKFKLLSLELNERSRRQWAAAEACELGHGGFSLVAKATGLSRPTIAVGRRELELPKRQRSEESLRIRRPGGGRRRATENDPELMKALESLIEPLTRGDPESPLRWTCKSTRKLADELTRQHHPINARTVADLLQQAGYSLQANCKTREGQSHPDRNSQFEYINSSVERSLRQGQPAISVDTKKKELVGDFKNGGREWRPQGKPEEVRTHELGYPIVIDWATSVVAMGRVQQLAREGKRLPANAAVDADGRFTEEPSEVAALTTFGGHKGYGLSLINELIAAYIGGSLPTLRSRWQKNPEQNPEQGPKQKQTPAFYFQVIHPQSLEGNDFTGSVSQFENVRRVVHDILGHGNQNCLLPGQLEAIAAGESEKIGGLLFSANEIAALNEIANLTGCSPIDQSDLQEAIVK